MIWRIGRHALFFAAMTAAASLFAGQEVLYWMIDSSATITTDLHSSPPTTATIGDFFGSIGTYFPDLAADGSSFAARVRVTGGGITEDTFLDLYIPGYGPDAGGGAYGVEFGETGGYWGAGVPTGNQSPLGGFATGSPEYSFIVELGNIDSSDNWTTVATSAAETYNSIGAYIHETFDINPGQVAVWTPTQFVATPEPSGGLLTALGLVLLALRRGSRRKEA